jgi:hypothetical protein
MDYDNTGNLKCRTCGEHTEYTPTMFMEHLASEAHHQTVRDAEAKLLTAEDVTPDLGFDDLVFDDLGFNDTPEPYTLVVDSSSIQITETTLRSCEFLCSFVDEYHVRVIDLTRMLSTSGITEYLIMDSFGILEYHACRTFSTIPQPIPNIYTLRIVALKSLITPVEYNWVAHRSDDEIISLHRIASFLLCNPLLNLLNACIACKSNKLEITRILI